MSAEEGEPETSPQKPVSGRHPTAFQGVTDLEEVESLEVKHGCHEREQEADDAMLGEGSSAVMHLDYFHDVRRQVYAEALVYRTTPFYATKIALEQRVEEHRLLHAHLQALERSEENGPLLMPNEFFIAELLQSPSHDPVGDREEDRCLQAGGTSASTPSFWKRKGRQHGSRAGDFSPQSGDQLRHRGPRGSIVSPALSSYSSPRASPPSQSQTACGSDERRPAGMCGTTRSVPRFFWPSQWSGQRGRQAGAPSSLAVAMARMGTRPEGADVGDAEKRAATESGASSPRDFGSGEKDLASPPASVVETCGGTALASPLPPVSSRASLSSEGPVSGKHQASDGFGCRDKKMTFGVPYEMRDGFPQGSTGVLLYHTKAGDKFWDRMDGQAVKLVSNAGGERHVLNWNTWLQRQRERGWFASEALCFMTTLGAVMGAGTFTSFWSQLQIWRSLWFLVPYTIDFVTVGVPALQTELLMGNLFRGTTLKCFTHISPNLVGAGLFALLSTLMQVTIKASQGCQLLVYFLASWKTPHPWELTEEDRQLCRSISDGDTCDDAGKGTLCHWRGAPMLECLASPTGKATYFYLSRLVPDVLDPTVSPNSMQGNHVASMGVVWAFILAYVWKGLFKIGFMSALLVFGAIVLCIALTVMSFTTADGEGWEDTQPDVVSESAAGGSHTLSDIWSIRAQTLGYVLHDLTLGCGVYETVSSFSKIGSNIVASANRVGLVDFVSCLVAFISLMSVVNSMQNTTGVPTYDLVNKTRSAPAYFVIFPAVFDKVAASNVFSLFFYGGIFVLNIQVTAIALHSLINAFEESRKVRYRWRQRYCVCLIVICFIFSLVFCSANQHQRFEFFNFVSSFMMAPGVVMLEGIAVGWVNNVPIQDRIAGRLSVRLYAACCLAVTILSCFISVYGGMALYFPRFILIFVNAGLAALVAFCVREPGASPLFKDRFRALYLGNIEAFKEQIMRVTLFNRPPIPAVAWLASVFRMTFGCLVNRLKPFCLSRISLFWCVMVKHMVPSSMMFLICKGFAELPNRWASLEASPHVRCIGLTYVIFAFVTLFAAPFFPKIRTWVCPPSEDYMPPYMFPLHPYRPPPQPNLLHTCARMFAEFSASSRHTSRFLYSLLADYKRQHVYSWRGSCRVEQETEGGAGIRRQLLSRKTERFAIAGDVSARPSPAASGALDSEE
ncbi:transporter, related [Neospora caninum Liverpool]|uniref:Transporter, related n=1 Tax=Neospora caninum (strain Liverpool) TaxID=572307 RepID=F0V7Y0_NEOCL|nr:transporter, related [Neospora caninum Liverpool]CBZ49821.1 transporter, related [Neospora caninum Liverpool]|eukprot:XP_003879856.1 transporter, related [Neospora caninum Liverpool]